MCSFLMNFELYFSYSENVKNLSDLMKISMKQKPMDNALWWLEFLSETKGAEHLKLSSRHLNFVEYYSLDFICICCLILFIVYKVFKMRSAAKKQKKD